MLAADGDHADVVAVLLDNDADPTLKNEDDETALELAESWDNEDTIEVLKQVMPAATAAPTAAGEAQAGE